MSFMLAVGGAFAIETKAANYTVFFTVDINLPGSLRDAVAQANASPADDTITFAILENQANDPGCAGSVCTVTLTNGGLFIQNNGALTINAGSGKIIVSGNNQNGVFSIRSGAVVTLNNLTVSGGNRSLDGGGIVNAGFLTLNNSTISSNHGTDGTNSVNGAGIFNSGTATIMNSTIFDNRT